MGQFETNIPPKDVNLENKGDNVENETLSKEGEALKVEELSDDDVDAATKAALEAEHFKSLIEDLITNLQFFEAAENARLAAGKLAEVKKILLKYTNKDAVNANILIDLEIKKLQTAADELSQIIKLQEQLAELEKELNDDNKAKQILISTLIAKKLAKVFRILTDAVDCVEIVGLVFFDLSASVESLNETRVGAENLAAPIPVEDITFSHEDLMLDDSLEGIDGFGTSEILLSGVLGTLALGFIATYLSTYFRLEQLRPAKDELFARTEKKKERRDKLKANIALTESEEIDELNELRSQIIKDKKIQKILDELETIDDDNLYSSKRQALYKILRELTLDDEARLEHYEAEIKFQEGKRFYFGDVQLATSLLGFAGLATAWFMSLFGKTLAIAVTTTLLSPIVGAVLTLTMWYTSRHYKKKWIEAENELKNTVSSSILNTHLLNSPIQQHLTSFLNNNDRSQLSNEIAKRIAEIKIALKTNPANASDLKKELGELEIINCKQWHVRDRKMKYIAYTTIFGVSVIGTGLGVIGAGLTLAVLLGATITAAPAVCIAAGAVIALAAFLMVLYLGYNFCQGMFVVRPTINALNAPAGGPPKPSPTTHTTKPSAPGWYGRLQQNIKTLGDKSREAGEGVQKVKEKMSEAIKPIKFSFTNKVAPS